MIAPPPARCATCNAPAQLYLVADPGTPIYACGSTPRRVICAPPVNLRPDVNVRALRHDETLELGELMGRMVVAWAAYPVVGICTVPGCDRTAVDGLCLTHGE